MVAVASVHPAPFGTGRATLASALREAVVTMLAAMGALLCTFTIAKGPGPAVLAVVLSLSLARSQLDCDWRHRIEAGIVLPFVGLAAIAVGTLLQHLPWLGAGVFVVGMFLSIWLRRFGPDAQRAGSLIALPFVALLVTPPIRLAPGSSIPALLLPIIIALLALMWVGVLHALAQRIGFLPEPATAHATPTTLQQTRESTLRPVASTRMAIQMAVALAVSFVVGYVLFANRWAWIVLTAFIVISGNRGRLDVAYKSALRIGGAAAGTILALSISVHVGEHGMAMAALILAAIFMGVWLRPLNYIWWALFVTVALALLQGFGDAPTSQILMLRLEEIVIGAAISVASAWFVFPVRSTDVLRRRMADALAAFAVAVDPATEQSTPSNFCSAIAGVDQLAPAFRARRRVARFLHRRRSTQPADWIDALVQMRFNALNLIESGVRPAEVRRAIGAARKCLREPTALLQALQALRITLDRALADSTKALKSEPENPRTTIRAVD
ncbi:MAG: FUSC family protein [Rudaea sp.]